MIATYLLLASSAFFVAHAGEYLIDLNTDLITSDTEQKAFVDRLESEFDVTWIEDLNVGSLRMLHVSADEDNADRVSELAEVNLIEPNAEAHVTGVDTRFCHKRAAPETWGLDRIDQREKLDSNNPFNKYATYTVGPYRGAGVVAYIVDTGIDISHPEFGNRAYWGFTATGLTANSDENGHGTHVAGTVGSTSYGMAKEVILAAVKVFWPSGLTTNNKIISGLNWVFNDHFSKKSAGENPKSVVNLSFGGSISACLDNAVNELTNVGIIAVASAGNDNSDACHQSPARLPAAITVGATNVQDKTWTDTNWGTCVDVFAPGEAVKSTLPGIKNGVLTGTSMSAPHVTGLVAMKLGRDVAIKSPSAMSKWISTKATRGAISFLNSNHKTSPDRLLYTNCMV